MSIVYYSGINRHGEKFHRVDEVDDIDDLYEIAEKNDEELIQFVRLPAIPGLVRWGGAGKLKDKEVVEFCQQLSMYLEGGVELFQIFQDILAEPISRRLRRVVKVVSARLNEGETLSEAFRETKALPDIVITLVEIGERSGNIGQALKDAAVYIEREMELRSATFRALIYPAFTVSIMLVALVFWITFVIPQVVKVIKIMDVELPIQTQMLLAVSEFMQEHWLSELMVFFGTAIIISVGRRFKRFRYYLDKLWWYMPITGRVVISSQMAFYFNYFKVLYDAGIPVVEVLSRLQRSVPNRYFRKSVELSNKFISEGDTLQHGYEKAEVFEGIAIRIISVGEHTGNLQKQLDLLGHIYLKRVQVFVETLPKVLEPVFIVAIGIFFVLFASTLLGPLYEVITKISNATN